MCLCTEGTSVLRGLGDRHEDATMEHEAEAPESVSGMRQDGPGQPEQNYRGPERQEGCARPGTMVVVFLSPCLACAFSLCLFVLIFGLPRVVGMNENPLACYLVKTVSGAILAGTHQEGPGVEIPSLASAAVTGPDS